MKRLLIIGCGNVGLRVALLLRARYRIYALTHSAERLSALRRNGLMPLLGDLDQPDTLAGLPGLAHDVIHLAPPPPQGGTDTRTAHLIAALARARSLPQHFIYISTSGVYGDCSGALVDETSPLRPQTDRARRRADAERRLREWGARTGVRVSILRVPGIYAADRLPVARIERGTPALLPQDDAYVNHIHADDLASMVVAALHRGQANRSYNASDDAPQKMGDYFDLVADRFLLPRPPRVTRAEASSVIPENLYSFMRESRRLINGRIKQELRVRLRYPTVREGIAAAGVRQDPDHVR
ncbi:MAG: NAD-dependent epimerase/dehydratase family protein [Betaproteobacteria bacterium]|nr:MAG: NAD-dependent epimerase/dehydratase family protein [Betaproteobacteria bacterium]